ncbi:MAG: bifunctional glutamate N-acetyltransferase/amino-acid acetyltransferase ArgJ [Actinomycetota bacterium]
MSLIQADGGVCLPRGFLAAGVASGIKRSGGLDLALIVSEIQAACAGVFTTNLAAAAPVLVSRDRIKSGSARGVVVNSGCANACTGRKGHQHALDMADVAAKATKIPANQMLVCSTGLIGSYLPMDKVLLGATKAASALTADDEKAMKAIMTTDTRPKRIAYSNSAGWSIGGIAKGSGMIAPNMATMLGFVTTDAAVSPAQLRSALIRVTKATFNAISVDGDTSTNDTVLVFANGHSGVSPSIKSFTEALESVCSDLAEMIVIDGEGAEKIVRIKVAGAANRRQAEQAARTVAESLLVKTAIYGGDANWGRVAAALGRSGASFELDRLTISMGNEKVFANGQPGAPQAVTRARAAMKKADIAIVCDLGAGKAIAEMLTTDMTPKFVNLNAEYEV